MSLFLDCNFETDDSYDNDMGSTSGAMVASSSLSSAPADAKAAERKRKADKKAANQEKVSRL